MKARRLLRTTDPYCDPQRVPAHPWTDDNPWPASWIRCHDNIETPFVCGYRHCLELAKEETFELHVTADERYELFVDGEFVGRGPERSDTNHWCYHSYELSLEAGPHVVSARVWSLGSLAPGAQMSHEHGFLLAADCSVELSTGKAAWEAKEIDGLCFPELQDFSERATGMRNIIDLTKYPEGVEAGEGDGWHEAVVGRPAQSVVGVGHRNVPPYLYPSMLPDLLNDEVTIGAVKVANAIQSPQQAQLCNNMPDLVDGVQQLLSNETKLEVPARTSVWVLVDLEDYYCTFPQITLSGHGTVSVEFSESLSTESRSAHTVPKGNRAEFDGKYWVQFRGDTYKVASDRSRTVSPLWFRTGCWMALTIESGDAPLTIEALRLFETRYPLENRSSFKTNDPSFDAIEQIMFRTLQMCMHDTYFDCPYYEQLMYLGDTRLQALVTYLTNGDSRLARKALKVFDWSRDGRGHTASCYPSEGSQRIPPFSLVWIGMLHDHLMWTDVEEPKSFLPCMRSIIEFWENYRTDNGLISSPPGWNFVDWARPDGIGTFLGELPRWGYFDYHGISGVKWDIGTPPDGYEGGISGVLNLFYAYFLSFAIGVEEHCGEPEMAARYRRLQRECFDATHEHFYSAETGMYADDLKKSIFSEHSQCLALLSGLPEVEICDTISASLFDPKVPVAETTYYFSHYYFETCRNRGRIDKLIERQQRWQLFPELGLKTTIEEPEPSRSDCHAWGAHPLFHWHTTILGIRPAAPSCSKLVIEPQLGPLEFAEGKTPLAGGFVEMCVKKNGDRLVGSLSLPTGVSATLRVNDDILEVSEGASLDF